MTTYKFATFNGRLIALEAIDQRSADKAAQEIAKDWGTLVRRRA